MARTISILALMCLVAAGTPAAPPPAPESPGGRGEPGEGPATFDDDEDIGADVPAAGLAPGQSFPSLQLSVLPPGKLEVQPLDLGTHLGRRPVVLVYFKIGNALSEEIYLEVQDFVAAELGDKVALYPVTALGGAFELSELHERMRLLGIRHPVILDEGQLVSRATKVRFVPNITLVNSYGELSYVDARSLLHPVHGDLTTRDTILMASRGERPPAKKLWPHYPARDLIGKPVVRMTLPEAGTGAALRIADFLEPGRVTALLYWSPRCPYSKRVMPGVIAAMQTFGGKQLNLLSVVRDGSDEEVRAYAEAQGMRFPIARNKDKRFSTKYRVISTPTLITIRPDGSIDDVFTNSDINFFAVLRARIERLVLTPASKPAGERTSG